MIAPGPLVCLGSTVFAAVELINPTRVQTDQCFPTLNETKGKSGTPGGTLPPDFDRYDHFRQLLLDADFTPAQLVLISDAMKEAGLMTA